MDGQSASFVDQFIPLIEQAAEVFHWVDRLLTMLDDSPETEKFLSERYGPLMWAIDHLKEARFAMEEGT
jgi:hypothetical protein